LWLRLCSGLGQPPIWYVRLMAGDQGLLERIELLGETYQVQTEIVDAAAGKLRTVVFAGGQVVALREATLHGGSALDADPESLQELLVAHHRLVIRTFIRRTEGFEARRQASPPPDVEASKVVMPEEAPGSQVPSLPPVPEDPGLCDGLDVRRLYGELRYRIERRPDGPRSGSPATTPAAAVDPPEEAIRKRLRRALTALRWVVQQPQFRNIRLDEQARFARLEERISLWDQAGANPEEAEWIWTEVVFFCGYVAEVNQRADLLQFDGQVVAWGLDTLSRHGPDRARLRPLQWLFGRDRELDLLLASEAEATAEEWRERLLELAGQG
jgi:hypothetical protein